MTKRFNWLWSLVGLQALVWWVFAVFTALAVISWYPEDPSFLSYASGARTVHNIGGIVGAQLAALLWLLFGSAAFLIPYALIYIGWYVVFGSWRDEWDRIVSGFFFVIFVAGSAAWFNLGSYAGRWVQGGVLGKGIIALCTALLPLPMISPTLILMLIASIIMMTRLALVVWLHRFLMFAGRHLGIILAFSGHTSWKVLKHYTAWLRSLWDGTFFAVHKELIYDAEDEELFKEMHGIQKDEFWHRVLHSPAESESSGTGAAVEKEVHHAAAVTGYQLPDISFLPTQSPRTHHGDDLKERAKLLTEKLSYFGVQGVVRDIHPGPIVTLYEFEPTIESKLSKLTGLEDDLALALQSHAVRVIAPIPGTPYVGFEVANRQRETVFLGPLLRHAVFQSSSAVLPLALGVTTTGAPAIIDLTKMPHLLVAGSTGAGKSVCLNTILASLLVRRMPDELRLILIDPKRLEFGGYADIPHLVFPIVTQPARAISALKWAVGEMERRYDLMARVGAKSIHDYRAAGHEETLPYLVIVIDELADLMVTAGKQVEDLLMRLAQMARAAGIHLIVATQRPSVDVITGVIKVNFPARIAFRVTSKIDSRTIIDELGAEKLLGKGDMLLLDPAQGMMRLHGAYLQDDALLRLLHQVKKNGAPTYQELSSVSAVMSATGMEDSLYDEVERFIQDLDEVSISLVQRRFRIGYNRSARLIEQLQANGRIVSAEGGRIKKVVKWQKSA